MTARWLAWSILSPSQLILGALAVGLVMAALGRGRWARPLLWFGGVGLLVFGVLPTSSLLARLLESRFPAPELATRVDGIVLVAGAEKPYHSPAGGEPQVGSHGGRYLTFLRLVHAHPEARIVYSGDSLADEHSQSAVAVRILGSLGVDSSQVAWDDRSQDSCDNAQRSHALARPRAGERWVVVTSALHVPRLMACFRSAGWPGIVPLPTAYRTVVERRDYGSVQVASNLVLLDEAAHEWVGLAFYRLTGRTHELFPAPQVGI